MGCHLGRLYKAAIWKFREINAEPRENGEKKPWTLYALVIQVWGIFYKVPGKIPNGI